MSNFNHYPSAESEVSDETLMELISIAQEIARTDGTSGSLYDGEREVWVAGVDDEGGEINIEILAYDHSLTIPQDAQEINKILEVNTSRNYVQKAGGQMAWEDHDYVIFNQDGELAVRKKFNIVTSDEPDLLELYQQGRIVHLPTAPEHVRQALERQARRDREANQLAEELRMNVPPEQEIRNLIDELKTGRIEPIKNLDLTRMTDEELHEAIRKRAENE